MTNEVLFGNQIGIRETPPGQDRPAGTVGVRCILMLAAVTKTSRHGVMSIVNDAVMVLGGWISGHELYGNMVTVFKFELAPKVLPALAERLDAAAIRLDDASRAAIAEAGETAEEIPCALNVTFIHDEPDVKREVPAVPG